MKKTRALVRWLTSACVFIKGGNELSKKIRAIVYMLVVFVFGVVGLLPGAGVEAIGYTTAAPYGAISLSTTGCMTNYTGMTWSQAISLSANASVNEIGYEFYTDYTYPSTFSRNKRQYLSWNTSTFAGKTIKGITASIHFTSKQIRSPAASIQLCLIPWTPTDETPGTVIQGDYNLITKANRLTDMSDAITGESVTHFDVSLTFNAAGIAYFQQKMDASLPMNVCILTGYDVASSEPPSGNAQWQINTLNMSTTASENTLQVTYEDALPARNPVVPDNDPGHGGVGGTMTGVYWQTPRCAYNDETMGFGIAGTSGQAVTLNVVNSSGTVVRTTTGEIRDNGYFYYGFTTTGLSGLHRAEAVATGLTTVYSVWGYIDNVPDASQPINEFQVKYTKSDLSAYKIDDFMDETGTEIWKISWNTNVTLAEQADLGIGVQRRAKFDDLGSVYHDTFADLAGGYFYIGYSNNNILASRRYMFVTLNAVDESYDDLYWNMNVGAIYSASGVYVPMLVDEWDEIYPGQKSHTGIWFVDAKPYNIAWDKSQYAYGSSGICNSIFTTQSMGWDTFTTMGVQLRSTDSPTVGYFSGSSCGVEVDMDAPTGSYTSIITFGSTNFDWVDYKTIKIGAATGTVPPSPTGGIPDFPWEGIDSELTRMGVVLALGIFGAVAPREPWLKILLVTLVLGAAIVVGWVAWWVWVLIAIVIGYIVMKLIMNGSGA